MVADLHVHTNASDGVLDVKDLFDLASQKGLWGLSLTDHDTLEAYREAFFLAEKKNIILGTGVELSCEYKKASVHVLGYDFRLDAPCLQELCIRRKQERKERNKQIILQLQKKGIKIEEEELPNIEGQTVGRVHIAQLLVKKQVVSSTKEAFQLYLADGKSCYVPGTLLSVKEAIDAIKKAQGKPFLAHPHLLDKNIDIHRLLEEGFMGIEALYSGLEGKKRIRLEKIALKKKLLISGGSDFHGGSVRPHAQLGQVGVSEEQFGKIFENRGKYGTLP